MGQSERKDSHVPDIFQRDRVWDRNLALLARALPRLTDAIGVVPETKIIIDRNPAKFAHKPVFQENPYLPRMPLGSIAPDPANSGSEAF